MRRSIVLLATCLAASSIGARLPRLLNRYCGTDEPSPALRAAHSYLQWAEPLDNDLQNATTVKQRQNCWHNQGKNCKRDVFSPLYTVDTYIHIVSDNASSDPSSAKYVTDAMIADQFSRLQNAYVNASIGFRYMGTDRTTNDTWASNGDDRTMKIALRKGTYRTLNIYYQTNLVAAPGTPGVPTGSILLGYCSLPSAGVSKKTPSSSYILDGCNILSSTLPGFRTPLYGYNLGGTTIHEVGHWNGLLHTFAENSCSPYSWGDYVYDTPQELTATSGCPTGKDTCPGSGVQGGLFNGVGSSPYGPQGYAGVDPIGNFMDYSSDACYVGFTPGQGARMLNIWTVYRDGL